MTAAEVVDINFVDPPQAGEGSVKIPLSKIRVNPANPRRDATADEAMVESVRQLGLIEAQLRITRARAESARKALEADIPKAEQVERCARFWLDEISTTASADVARQLGLAPVEAKDRYSGKARKDYAGALETWLLADPAGRFHKAILAWGLSLRWGGEADIVDLLVAHGGYVPEASELAEFKSQAKDHHLGRHRDLFARLAAGKAYQDTGNDEATPVGGLVVEVAKAGKAWKVTCSACGPVASRQTSEEFAVQRRVVHLQQAHGVNP